MPDLIAIAERLAERPPVAALDGGRCLRVRDRESSCAACAEACPVGAVAVRAAAVEDTCRTYTENSFFCRSTYRFDGRFLLVRMENFQKADFDAVKKRVNHAVNREFHLPQRYAAGELAYKMRFYILYTEAANDELMRHISRNAETLLRRAEGVMTFVLCGDSLIVPPLYGDTDMAAVRRYAGAIRMMRDLLRHPRAH